MTIFSMTKTHMTALSGAALLAASLGFAAPVSAQQAAPRSDPQVVTEFNAPTITRLLTDVQADWRIEASAQGEINYRASAEGGLNFTLAPRACSPETGCLGLMVLAVFTGVDTTDPARIDAFLNDLNDQSATAKVYRSGDGIIILQAYINSSYGISYANAQAQLLVFGQNIVAVSGALSAFESGS